MKELKISDTDGNGYHSFFIDGNFEYENPIEKMAEMFITNTKAEIKNRLVFAKNKGLLPNDDENKFSSELVFERVATANALKLWEEVYTKITSQKVPDFLFKVLKSDSKKEQIRLLRNTSLSRNELMGFIFHAWENHGFTLSRYKAEHQHKGLDILQLPKVAYKKDDNSIVSFGDTSLTEGQIKQAIDNRKVIISRFLDNQSKWLCFFLTFKGLKGEETGGKSHLHFISNTWGHSRDYVLKQLTSDNYKLSSLPHVDYLM